MQTIEVLALKRNRRGVKIPFVDMICRYRSAVLLRMGARWIDGVFFNIFAVFMIGYLTQRLSMSRTEALTGVMVAAMVMCFFIPFFGRMSDLMGRARVYRWGSLICGASVLPAFWLMQTQAGNSLALSLGPAVPFGLFYAMVYGPEAALFAELFDPEVRYTGISFVYQFSGIFASGLTPIIATYLIAANGNQPWYLCAYVVFAALVSAACAAAIKGRATTPR